MERPSPPISLSKYLAEGIPKQNVETLRDVRKYVDVLIEYREQPVEADELPDSAQPVDRDNNGMGTVVLAKVASIMDFKIKMRHFRPSTAEILDMRFFG